MQTSDRESPPYSRLALAGFALAVLAAAAAVLAGLGSRWEWWHFTLGFQLLTWSAYAGVAAALLSLMGAVDARPGSPRRGLAWAALGVTVGLAVVAIPWSWRSTAEREPVIRDVSTDLEDPPEFVAVAPQRREAPDPLAPVLADHQRAAYPDIGPAYIGLPLDQAFDQALAVARGMGWTLIDAEEAEGRIEATAATRWFGFTDDIVIRLRPEGDSTRVDVRSASREETGDVATSARRVREYLEALEEATSRS